MSAVRDDVLAKVPDDGLRAYVVWTKILDEDDLAAARKAAASIHDPRVVQLWDGDAELARTLGEALRIPVREPGDRGFGLAWDVYLLYPARATWRERAPQPAFWMQQLEQMETSPVPLLDADVLRGEVAAALPRAPR
ncbi:MAG: hypothetical protein ACJ79E_21225 [Anaeromyxobacteraceae bacterium]